MNKLYASLLVVALLQVTTAQLIDDLVQEYKPLIAEREQNLGLNIGLDAKLIGQTYGILEGNIKEAVLKLTEKIVALDDSVQDAKTKATEANKNVDECVSAERSSVGLLNLGEVQNCRQVRDLVVAQIQLPKLGAVKRDLGSLLSRCIVPNQDDVDAIRSCCDSELQRIDNAISSSHNDIKDLVNNAVSNGNQCIGNSSASIENNLADIENNLNSCVDGVLNA